MQCEKAASEVRFTSQKVVNTYESLKAMNARCRGCLWSLIYLEESSEDMWVTRGHECKVNRLPLKLDLPWERLETMRAQWIGCLWSSIHFEYDERYMNHGRLGGWLQGAELRLHLKLDLPWSDEDIWVTESREDECRKAASKVRLNREEGDEDIWVTED